MQATNSTTPQGYVRTEVTTTGVAHLYFHHPQHNSLPSALLQALTNAFEELGLRTDVRVVVLRSAEHPNTFCAGASFDELVAIQDMDTSVRFFSGFGQVINAMRRCGKIVVGRIHGRAIGGGVGLAAATDICLAARSASIRLSELAVGFGPFVIGPAVTRKIGVAAFGQMALTPSEWQTAAWAKEKGLFQEVFESENQLDGYLTHLTDNLCQYSPAALDALKQVLWEGTEHWDTLLPERAAISGRLALTTESKNAIAAFKQK